MAEDERKPLLSAEPESVPEKKSSTASESSTSTEHSVNTITDFPAPDHNPGGKIWINCRACGEEVDITNRRDQFVVKCYHCQEHTPLKPCPGGKKYVGCICSCLLICKASSSRIQCQRANCKRVLRIEQPAGHNPVLPRAQNVPGMAMVQCINCQEYFPFNTNYNALARCPHCGRLSSVGAEFARRRSLKFLFFGLILLTLALGITFGTIKQAQTRSSLYALYAFLFLITFLCLWRSLMYCTMKVSPILSQANP